MNSETIDLQRNEVELCDNNLFVDDLLQLVSVIDDFEPNSGAFDD